MPKAITNRLAAQSATGPSSPGQNWRTGGILGREAENHRHGRQRKRHADGTDHQQRLAPDPVRILITEEITLMMNALDALNPTAFHKVVE
jgi:hypothetical protein